MSLTMSEAITQLRENRLNEKVAAQWQDDELRRWLNEAARDIARRAEILQTTENVSFLAGVQENTAPTNVIRIHRVEWRPGDSDNVYPLEYRDFHNMDAVWWTHQIITQNTPQLFTLWGYPPNLKIVLYPTPNVAGNAKLHYYRTPTELTVTGTQDNSTIDLPEGWTDLALDYTEYKALRKDRDPAWQEAKQEYEQHLNDMMQHLARWTDQAGMIVNESSNMLPAWLYGGEW